MKNLLVAIVLLPSIIHAQNNIHSYWVTSDGEAVKKTNISHWTSQQTNTTWDGDTVRLYAAKNEIIAFQLHIRSHATNTLSKLDVSLDTLAMGTTRITNKNWAGVDLDDPSEYLFDYVGRRIEVFTVAYTDSLKCRGGCSGTGMTCPGKPISDGIPWSVDVIANNVYVDTLYAGHLPAALIPKEASVKGTTTKYGGMPMDVAANRIQAVWFDIFVPASQTAGYYTGNIRIRQNAEQTITHSIPVKLRVFNVALSDSTFMPTWAAMNGRFNRRYNSVGDQTGDYSGGPQFWSMIDKYAKFSHRHMLSLSPAMAPDTFRAHYVKFYTGSGYSASAGYEGPGQNLGDRLFSIGTYDQGNGPNYIYGVDNPTTYGSGWRSGFYPSTEDGWHTAADNWGDVLLDNGIDTSRTGYHSFFKYMMDEPRNIQDAEVIYNKSQWLLSNTTGKGKSILSYSSAYAMDAGANSYPTTYVAGYINRYIHWIGMAGHPSWGGETECDGCPPPNYGRLGWIRSAVTHWRGLGKRVMMTSGGWPSAGQYQGYDMPMVSARIFYWISMLYPMDGFFAWHSDYLPHEVGFADNSQRDYWKMDDYNSRSGGYTGFDISGATNTSPVSLTLAPNGSAGRDNFFRNGEVRAVWIVGLRGNTSANSTGQRYIRKDPANSNRVLVYSNGAATTPVAGNGTYTGGGFIRPWEGSGRTGTGTIIFSGEDKVFPSSNKGVPGPVATINLKNMRRGAQDYKIFTQARRTFGWDAIKHIVWNVMPTAADSVTSYYTGNYDAKIPYSLRGDEYEIARVALLQKMDGTGAVPPSITSFEVSPPSGYNPLPVTITYAVSGADSVKLNGVKLASAVSGTSYDTIEVTTNYMLMAYNDGTSVSSSRSVTVADSGTTPSGLELIVNGSFERTGGWSTAASGGVGNSWARTAGGTDSSYYWRWVVGSVPGTYNQTYQPVANVFPVEQGEAYRLQFDVMNTGGGSIRVRILPTPTYSPVIFDKIFALSAGVWLNVDTVFTSSATSSSMYAQFLGSFGTGVEYMPPSSVTSLDAISLQKETVSSLGSPVVTYPTASAVVDTPLTVTWTTISGASSYHVQVDVSPTFAVELPVDDTVSVNEIRIDDTLRTDENYYVRVRALSALDASDWGDDVSFRIYGGAPPSAPTLVSPKNNARGLSPLTSFYWTEADSAESYIVQFSSNESFTDTLIQFGANDASYEHGVEYTSQFAFLDWATTYWWRVKALNSIGSSAWSTPFKFRVSSRRGVRTDKVL